MKMFLKNNWVFVVLIFAIPIMLNFILPLSVPFVNIIGGDKSVDVWLNFFSSYIGAIISSAVAFYVLYKNRKDNFSILEYNIKYSELQSRIKDLVYYIDIYNLNNIKSIYNDWVLKNKPVDELRKDVKKLLDNSFIVFETFAINYPSKKFREDKFFIEQYENYISLVAFLQDLQILLDFDSEERNNILAFRSFLDTNDSIHLDHISVKFRNNINQCENKDDSIFNILLNTYNSLNFNKIEKQVRTFVEEEYNKLDSKYKNITNG